MRVLHTSDWHVGRTFHGVDLLSDQRTVLQAIADLVQEHRVDVVVIAGDLYDRAVPSAEAISVLTGAFAAIRAAGAVIVASSGNHDSAPRLGAFREFLDAGGLHLRTDVRAVGTPIVLHDEHGPVVFHAIPYLDPEMVRGPWELTGRLRHEQILTAAMQKIRADLDARPGCRSVVLAHAFVVGAVAGGSERSIAVGGVESVSAEIFDGIGYVALGHLHGRQRIADHIRYSGSPLPFSFGEAAHHKGVLIVDIDAAGSLAVTPVDLPVPRPLAEISGTLEQVLAGHDELTEHYLAVTLTDPVRPLESMRRVRSRFPYAVTLSWQPPAGSVDDDAAPTRPGASDHELVEEFLQVCRGAGADPVESAIIDRALAAALQDADR